MAKTDTTMARSPRGTKPVSQAFFAALDGIPETNRAAVAKAALGMIREQMTLQRDKAKAAAAKQKATAAKEKARTPVAEKPVAAKTPRKAKAAAEEKPAPEPVAAAEPKAAPAKRRTRKTAEAPVPA